MSNIIDKIQLSGVTYDIGGQGGSGVSVVEVTQAAYDALPSSAKTDTSKMYVITDAEAGDLTNYYTKTETNTLLGGKQATLVSGTNIKTINNESILGSGNIDIQGGGGKAVTGGTNISVTTGETADTINCTLPMFSGSAVGASKINHTNNVASGLYSNAEGQFTTASRNSAHAEGNGTTASGDYSHAEGYKTTASENSAHAEGGECVASGERSHAEGYKTTASTYNSHTEGYYTVAYNSSEHSNGKYNVSNTGSTDADKTLFSVGNGTSNSARHNAFEIRQNGDIYCTDGTNDVKLQDTIAATAANTTALGGLKLVKLTQAEYDALATKDNSTLYVIVN